MKYLLPLLFSLSLTAAQFQLKCPYYHFGEHQLEIAVSGLEEAEKHQVQLEAYDRFRETVVKTVKLPVIAGKITIELPYGSYELRGTLLDADGAIVGKHAISVQSMSPDCVSTLTDEETEYEFRYGFTGGCQDDTTPEISARLGRRWFRFELPNWGECERKSMGHYDLAQCRDYVMPWISQKVRPCTLQTLYAHPGHYPPTDLAAFSSGYGHYLKAYGKEMAGLVEEHELGNEDNGANKYLYTEVGRHGAAALRSVQPFCVLGNSGTGSIDYSWLQFQCARRLGDSLDAYVVHPYTNNSTCSESASPEAHHTLEQLDRLYELVFTSGGMKELWNTEYGWPNGGPAEERARTACYLRMLLLNDVVGVRQSVVYNWDRDYNTCHHPAVVALHYFAMRRQIARFVGATCKDNIWTVVYERHKKPFAVQWTTLDGEFPPTIDGEAMDAFGNAWEKPKISRLPIFFDKIPQSVVNMHIEAQAKRLQDRFLHFYQSKPLDSFKTFLNLKATDVEKLRLALLNWLQERNAPITSEEQALFHFALDWYLQTGRNFSQPDAPSVAFDAEPFREQVLKDHANLLSCQALRYLLRQADRLERQRKMTHDEGDAHTCGVLLHVLLKACQVFSRWGERIQYAAFANLYQERNGKLEEHLSFVAGVPTKLRVRVSNYADRDVNAQIRPLLPAGWKATEMEPLTVPANGEAWTDLTITVPSGANAPDISIAVLLKGCPARVTTFNWLEYLPAISLTMPVLEVRDGHLALQLHNQETNAVSGHLKLLPAGNAGAPLALIPYQVEPKAEASMTCRLSESAARRLAEAGYQLNAQFLPDNGQPFILGPLDVESTIAIRHPQKTGVQWWRDAPPLRLDQEEYAWGSYGNSWSPDDLSATTTMAWDDEKLYFHAIVNDQVMNQTISDDGVWHQDSIQLLFMLADRPSDQSPVSGFWLALTPKGPLAWSERQWKHLVDCQLDIVYQNKQCIYDFAVPWAQLGPEFIGVPKFGAFKYAIAINDDDVLVPRRFLERFRGTVVHGRDLTKFATVRLEKQPPVWAVPPSGQCLLWEDFEMYPAGGLPLGYDHQHTTPASHTLAVVAGKGEHGGQALLIHDDNGGKPNCYCLCTVPFEAPPGTPCRVTFRLKGRNCAAGRLGICSDLWGNKDFIYLALPQDIPEWKDFSLEFNMLTTGGYRLMLGANNSIDELLIDSIKITKQ